MKRFQISSPQWRSPELLFTYRVLICLLLWKFLSIDYHSLNVYGQFDPLQFPTFPWTRLAAKFGRTLFLSPTWVSIIQLGSAAALAVAAWKPKRPTLTIGLSGVLFIEWTALLYRYSTWDLEIPTALLLILCLQPFSFRQIFSHEEDSGKAPTLVGVSWAVYMSWVYFFAGLAKLTFDPLWPLNVHLEGLRPLEFQLGMLVPTPIDTFANLSYQSMARWPWISPLLASISLAAELFWFTSLFWVRTRRWLPVSAVLMHLGIYLNGGPPFTTFALSAFLVSGSWQAWRSNPTPRVTTAYPRLVLTLSMVSLLCVVPSLTKRYDYPWMGFFWFGWSYKADYEAKKIYTVGYLNSEGDFQRISAGYFGLRDFRFQDLSSAMTLLATTKDPSLKAHARKQVATISQCLRPHNSHRKYLGILAHPFHVPQKDCSKALNPPKNLWVARTHLTVTESEVAYEDIPLGPLDQYLETES